jgi:two-component system response regulator YesN
MIHLLIVDDERHIADWLYGVFSDENLPGGSAFEFECYRAYDPVDALDVFRRYKVDILLSDIYMPGMSGLEMLDVIHQTNPNCHVVFLTGYNEFDDIYRATRSRNARYLSKTEGDGEIVRAVLDAARELTAEKERIDESLLQQNMIKMLSQRELMLRLLLGEHDQSDLSAERLRWYGIPFDPARPVLLLSGRITETPDSLRPAARMEILNRMCLLFHSQFSHGYEQVQTDCRPSLLVWVLQPKNKDGAVSTPKLRSMLEDFSAACYDALKIGLSFLLYEKPIPLSELSLRFSQAEDSLGALLGQERGIILSADGKTNDALPPAVEANGLREGLRALAGLQTALEQGNREKAGRALEKILPALAGFRSRHSLQAAELYFGIANVLTACINRMRIMEEIAFQISLGRLSAWFDFASWQEAADYLRKLCDVVIGILENKLRTGGDVVERVTDFISQHLGEDLSLTRIGECVNYNPAYLSRVFKRVTGKNISAIITERRLQKAIGLLLRTNDTIAHIAALCGIENPQYFITVFRKYYGTAPQEFRMAEKQLRQ